MTPRCPPATQQPQEDMTEPRPRIQLIKHKDIIQVILMDQEILDEFTINEITTSLFSVIEEHQRIRMILDFQHVTHLSSSALGTLIRINKKVEESDGQFRICSVNKALSKIFEITRLDKVFAIDSSVDASLATM